MKRPIKILSAILIALVVLTALGLWVMAHAGAPQMPQGPVEWQQAATRDINAAYEILLANHPGVQDPHNPGFINELQQARAHGLALAKRVTTAPGYMATVMAFNTRLQDGHAGMGPRLDASVRPAQRWPGFVAVWRGDMVVYASEEGDPPVGARVLSCDGKDIKLRVTENVFGFQGRIAEEGQWWSMARLVFADWGNPLITLPARCSFEADGKQFELDLNWRPMTEQAFAWHAQSYDGESLEIGLTEPRKNLFWIAMPTYQPNEAQRTAYRSMYREVSEHRQRYLDADAIVIDLRQNHGGASMWSADLASTLWGGARVLARRETYFANTEAWYLASPENADYYGELLTQLEKEPQPAAADWVRDKAQRIKGAIAHGKKFAIVKDDLIASMPASSADLPAFTKPVYVIVPGNCASGCLEALDMFSLFPNTKLIGAPSSADSNYSEVRLQPVASGLAIVAVPTKLYVNRPRGSGVFYRPAIYVDDVKWSNAAFLQVVEKDLASH